jgi:hypothetical protein
MRREEAPCPPKMVTTIEKEKAYEKKQKNSFHNRLIKNIYNTMLTSLFLM